jgi:hypothetical protein
MKFVIMVGFVVGKNIGKESGIGIIVTTISAGIMMLLRITKKNTVTGIVITK